MILGLLVELHKISSTLFRGSGNPAATFQGKPE
jgi:hypothetical protein